MRELAMNGNPHIHKIFICIFIFSFYIQSGCENGDHSKDNEQPLSEFQRLIAERPVPNLETLAERSAPDYSGEDATEAFYDILKLRDVGDNEAVPVLEKILSDHVNSTRIHGYAAAQALFCIGTTEAHQVLSKYLLNEKYYAGLSINYIYHWEMSKSKRDDFIKKYHLVNLSNYMEIKLELQNNKDENGQKLNLTITLTNISEKPYRIRVKQIYLAQMLFFQSKSGQFIQWSQPIKYKVPMPKWLDSTPGESHQYNVSLDVRGKGTQKLPCLSKDENVRIMLETFDMICGIEKPGEFKVYAMLEEQPLTEAHLEQLGFDNPWSGRVVSEPVTVNIGTKSRFVSNNRTF
jgi:hypothetical protein